MGQQIRLYYHQDLRGTADYLTSPVSQKIESWTHYNEWGELTHNAVLKCGQRELDLVKNYTGHDYDAVLNLYYAKARMYDAENRRFLALDPIMDGSVYDISEQVTDPMIFAQYLYVKDNPLRWVDPLGLRADIGGAGGAPSGKTMYITGEGVAFRQGPGKNYSLVSGIRLSKGETVLYQGKTVDGINDGYTWSQVIYKSKVGWVAARYLSGHPQVNPIPKAKPAVKLPDVKNIQQIDHNKATPNTDVPKIPAPSHSEELMNGLQRLGEDAVSGATGVVAGFVFTMADSGVTATGGVIETFAPFMYSKEAFDNAHQEIQETDQMVADWAPNSSAYYDGKLFGDIIAGIAGLKSAISGAGGALDGMIKLGESAALAVSGAGAPVAVPVAVGGAGEVALGTVAVYVGGTVVLTAADAYDRDSQKAGESKQEKLECEGSSSTGDSGRINLDKKPTAHNAKLQNFINSLYKGQGNPNQIGNGTTMDAIRYELSTGQLVEGKSHLQKGQDFVNGINKLINSGTLDEADLNIANALVNDLLAALSGR